MNSIKNLSDLRADPAKLIALSAELEGPIYILNRSKPVSVLLDIKLYQKMVERLEDALDSLEMKNFEKEKKNKRDWISHESLLKKIKY